MDAGSEYPDSAPPPLSHGFDFDEWRRLAERNPRSYFRRRERVISAYICAHPEHAASLRRLQDRVDALRASGGSPQHSLRAIMQLLEDHVAALQAHLERLQRELDALAAGCRGASPPVSPPGCSPS